MGGLALAQAGSTAQAASICPQFFVGGQAPRLGAPPAGQNRMICLSGFALQHSSTWHEPIWSAEHLLAYEVPLEEADRRRPLHPESGLPNDERAELADYQADIRRYGRYPAAPVADFLDDSLREDASTLANTMPLARGADERSWAGIERRVRDAARAAGEVFIVTGPAVTAGGPLAGGRVAVPQAAWKAIYVPRTGLTGAFWVANDDGSSVQFITIAELTKRTGVDPFPALADSVKGQVFPAPELQVAAADPPITAFAVRARRGRR